MLASKAKVIPMVRRIALQSLFVRFGSSIGSAKRLSHSEQATVSSVNWLRLALGLGLGVTTAASITLMEPRKPHYPQPQSLSENPAVIEKPPRINQPPVRPDLPTFTREEVAEHCEEDSLWYTFRGAVYDLTPFYDGHPGGAPVSSNPETYLSIYFQFCMHSIT